MYNGGIPGGAINTGVPAAFIAVSAAGYSTSATGLAITLAAAANLLLLARAARQRQREFHTE